MTTFCIVALYLNPPTPIMEYLKPVRTSLFKSRYHINLFLFHKGIGTNVHSATPEKLWIQSGLVITKEKIPALALVLATLNSANTSVSLQSSAK